jgi:hypothetical protein
MRTTYKNKMHSRLAPRICSTSPLRVMEQVEQVARNGGRALSRTPTTN